MWLSSALARGDVRFLGGIRRKCALSVEQRTRWGTVYHYPQQVVMTAPMRIPMVGKVKWAK
jgi:hypothetical protein